MFLACKCNSYGTVSKKNLIYIREKENNLCNEESTCTCLDGYTENDCNACETENDYYLEETVNGENKCKGD